MYELTIKGETPQSLKEELKKLISVFEGAQAPQMQTTMPTPTVQAANIPPAQMAFTNTPLTPIGATPIAPITQFIPTTGVTQEYTLPQIQTAMGGLADNGKIAAIHQIMAEFGVNAVVDIPKERYGELATRLRTEGAQI